MKKLQNGLLLAFTLLASHMVAGQSIKLSPGDASKYESIKEATRENFVSGGYRYFLTKNFKDAYMHFNLLCFDNAGHVACENKLEIPLGEFKNTYSIDEVLPLGNKAYVLVEHIDKPAGKVTYSARVMDKPGKISSVDVELVSFPFEKINNSGYTFPAVSPDQNTMAVVSELPYVKEQPAKLKIVLLDRELKKITETEINLPGENTKNKNIKTWVANNGTVYVVKKISKRNGEIG